MDTKQKQHEKTNLGKQIKVGTGRHHSGIRIPPTSK